MSVSPHHAAGLALRHQIFGADATDAQIAKASPFLRPMQDMVTADCFGQVWTQPGLDLRQRSLATISMLIALGRAHELRIHVRGAIQNGVSVEELSALMRHAALYCGIPAAVDAWVNTDATLQDLGLVPAAKEQTP